MSTKLCMKNRAPTTIKIYGQMNQLRMLEIKLHCTKLTVHGSNPRLQLLVHKNKLYKNEHNSV